MHGNPGPTQGWGSVSGRGTRELPAWHWCLGERDPEACRKDTRQGQHGKGSMPWPALPVSRRCSNTKAFQSLCVFYPFGGTWVLGFPSPSPQPPPPGSPQPGTGGRGKPVMVGRTWGSDRDAVAACWEAPLGCVRRRRTGRRVRAVRARCRWRAGSWENGTTWEEVGKVDNWKLGPWVLTADGQSVLR